MTTGRRVAVAGTCIVTGLLMVWGVQRIERPTTQSNRIAPILSVGADLPAGPSVLWVLAIGVSHYQRSEFDLQFADADAHAIAEMLQHQGDGPLYREVKTRVLTNDGVTRESILSSMETFLGRAGPNDVAVIFIAGHAVQDLASGSYYFLPFAATAENLVTAGLRMSDFDEMVRVVRRNVRGLVVMLDTCHAGALRLPSSELRASDEVAAGIAVGEGLFLLAATKPGEESKEQPELAHGAFTYALLEGLEGAADAHGDGLLSVSDLFGYVARRVPQLTQGSQHPYNRVEGTDLVFAAVTGAVRSLPTVPVTHGSEVALARAATPVPNTIGVMEFHGLREDPEHDWIGKALRVALNTELSKVRELRVYAPELIDRTAAARKSDQLSTAQQLGIRKILTGSFSVLGNAIRIDGEIIDTASGVQEASDSVQGDLGDFFDLQKQLVFRMLHRLRVDLSPAEGESIQNKSNTNVDAYRLLLESEGVVEQGAPRATAPPQPSPATPQSHGDARDWIFGFAGRALAADLEEETTAAVRELLERYRGALERKDLDSLSTLYVAFPARQREALQTYLENATDLHVELADISIEPRGADVAVTYTRRDRFVDRDSAKPQRLEVRLTKILVREGGNWKFTSGR